MGYQGRCNVPSVVCITKVRAASIFSAQSQTCFQWGSDSITVAPCPILFVILMDRISRCSRDEESVRFGDLKIASLLFADDVVRLDSSDRDLQHFVLWTWRRLTTVSPPLALGRFTAECEVVGMKVSTSKSEAMVLCWKTVECSLRVGSELLPQVKEFQYLGVLFTSEGKMEHEMDRRISAASAVMWALYRNVVKTEMSRKAKVLIYQLSYIPTLTYGHELWIVTERTRSRIQAAEMSFLPRVVGLSLRDRVRSSDIRRELEVELLLLVEKEPAKVIWASDQDASWAPSLGGFPNCKNIELPYKKDWFDRYLERD